MKKITYNVSAQIYVREVTKNSDSEMISYFKRKNT